MTHSETEELEHTAPGWSEPAQGPLQGAYLEAIGNRIAVIFKKQFILTYSTKSESAKYSTCRRALQHQLVEIFVS